MFIYDDLMNKGTRALGDHFAFGNAQKKVLFFLGMCFLMIKNTWDLYNRIQRTKAAHSQAHSRSQSGLHPSSFFYLLVAHGPPLMSPSVFFVVAPAPPSFSERCKHISDAVG